MQTEQQKALLAELKKLVDRRDVLSAEITGWQHKHVADFAKFKIGQEVFYVKEGHHYFGQLAGVVVHYERTERFNEGNDCDMKISYIVKDGRGLPKDLEDFEIGTAEDLKKIYEQRIAKLNDQTRAQ